MDKWPARPYRGLKFYREKDLLLFRERDEDVAHCAEALRSFGVKLLVLQGSSGAGKSSFLRAGLIPYLKNDEARPTIFLNNDEPTIRCSSDPIAAIAGTLKIALDHPTFSDLVTPHVLKLKELDDLYVVPRKSLATQVVNALRDICSPLTGTLVIILDQVEEIFVRDSEAAHRSDESEALFFFLEEIYVRNIDIRIVLSLRTEYYGRFRDDLRISDNRLGARPKRGGIEPYLLRPLREKPALLRALLAPTDAKDSDGSSVYRYDFETGLADHIVENVLRSYPTGSVTPVLQVICLALYNGLNSDKCCITRADFDRLEGVDGIMQNYVLQGVNRAVGYAGGSRDQWYSVLHSLVSRQGGGALVSLNESAIEIEQRGREKGIVGDILAALFALSVGWEPLLRGEPANCPEYYSLQHDVLAVSLLRWKAAQKAEQAAREAELIAENALIDAKKAQLDSQRAQLKVEQAQIAEHHARRNNLYLLGLFLVVLVAVLTSAIAVLGEQQRTAYQRKVELIHARDGLANLAPRSNAWRALTLLITNVHASANADTVYESLFGDDPSLLKQTVDTLREVLVRTPDFVGQYRAAGMNPKTGQISLLDKDKNILRLYSIPSSFNYSQLDMKSELTIPFNSVRGIQKIGLLPAVGYVQGLGPVAILSAHAYHWIGVQGATSAPDLLTMLPDTFSGAVFPRAEFQAGSIIVTAASFSSNPTYDLSVRYLDASDIERNVKVSRSQALHDLERTSPGPVFSLSWDHPKMYAYLVAGTTRPAATLADFIERRYKEKDILPWSGGATPAQGYTVAVGTADSDSPAREIDVAPVSGASNPNPQQPPRASIAFASNRDIILFKSDGSDLYQLALSPSSLGAMEATERIRISFVPPVPKIPTDSIGDDRFSISNTPWVFPPLAGVVISKHLRAAWSMPRGIWLIENTDEHPENAKIALRMNGPLIAGEPGGTRLQFSNDGNVLMLLQQKGFNSPVDVRIWDLRGGRRDWIRHAPIPWLESFACGVLKVEGIGERLSGREAVLYGIDPKRSVCEKEELE